MDLLQIRNYKVSDKNDCLIAFKTNVPNFFIADEIKEFEKWLDEFDENYNEQEVIDENHYYVARSDHQIIGAGGFGYDPATNRVILAWGFITKEFQKKGFGSQLLLYRLQKIKLLYPGIAVAIDTTQYSSPFFERFGFVVEKITENFYTAGMHRHDMILKTVEP